MICGFILQFCRVVFYLSFVISDMLQYSLTESSPEASPASRHSGKFAFISSMTPFNRSQGSTKFTYSDKSFSFSNKTGKPNASPFGSAKSGDYNSGSLPPSPGNKSTEKFEKNKRSQQSRQNGSPLSDDSDSETEYLPTRGSRPSLSTSPFSVNKGAGVSCTPDGVESAWIATRSQSKVISESNFIIPKFTQAVSILKVYAKQ